MFNWTSIIFSMKKIYTTLVLLFFITSCNLLNIHNIRNGLKWKNKKLSKSIEAQLVFNPTIIKDFDSTSVLKYYFQDSNKMHEIESTLKEKLDKRNIKTTKNESKNSITIDTLIFRDKVEMINVLSNDATESLGTYEKNNISVKIIGVLNFDKSNSSKIVSEYNFSNEPRESFLLKGTIAYSNAWINLDKVINNTLNKFSYLCYKKIK